MKIDYDDYTFRIPELLGCLALGCGLILLVDVLCYRKIWVAVALLPLLVLFVGSRKRQLMEKRRTRLHYAFGNALTSLSVALKAGYSMENAVSEALRDLQKLYGNDEPVVQEFRYMQSQIRVNVPVETLFRDLGNRSGVEDIRSFSGVYGIAKRSGGDVGKILQNTAKVLTDKIEVQKEVEAAIAAKRMEHQIMSVIPCAVIGYMQLVSPGFLDVLYNSVQGMLVMTACLAVYVAAYFMGIRIVDIEV